jgi:hypothetical protein
MNIGVMFVPDALKETATVAVVPRSAVDRFRTYFLPSPEIMLDFDLEAVEIPVSSQL